MTVEDIHERLGTIEKKLDDLLARLTAMVSDDAPGVLREPRPAA